MNGNWRASAAANATRWLCAAVSRRASATFDGTRSIPTSRICEICRRPMLTSASPSPQPTSRMRLPGRGRSVSARNSVKSSSHQLSRRCLSVGEVNASISADITVRNYMNKYGRARESGLVPQGGAQGDASVGYCQLSRDDGARAGEEAEARHVADGDEDADEDYELHRI